MAGGYPFRRTDIDYGAIPSFDRVFQGGILMLKSAIKTADALIHQGPAIYYGHRLSVASATALITIEDGLTAAAGDQVDQIEISTAVGKYLYSDGHGILCPTGIFLNYAASATGSVQVLYWPANFALS